jgi:hypothetical protein
VRHLVGVGRAIRVGAVVTTAPAANEEVLHEPLSPYRSIPARRNRGNGSACIPPPGGPRARCPNEVLSSEPLSGSLGKAAGCPLVAHPASQHRRERRAALFRERAPRSRGRSAKPWVSISRQPDCQGRGNGAQ